MTENESVIAGGKTAYGVDVQGDTVVVVRGERSRAGVKHSSVAGGADSLDAAVREGAVVAAGLSSAGSFTRWLEAPFAGTRKTRKVLPTLLDIELPFALEDCIYSFLGLERTLAGKTRALAVVARRGDVEAKLRSLNELGVDPVLLDQEGLALWTQSLAEKPLPPGSSDRARVVVYLGVNRSCVAIGKGGAYLCSHGLTSAEPAHISRILRAKTDAGQDQGVDIEWFWTGR